MNIQEAKQAKRDLEEAIQKLLIDFGYKTGIVVSSLEVGGMTYQRISDSSKRQVTVSVSARCEL
jgi:hypothetical protein